jgi:hypothetical protein
MMMMMMMMMMIVMMMFTQINYNIRSHIISSPYGPAKKAEVHKNISDNEE